MQFLLYFDNNLQLSFLLQVNDEDSDNIP